MKLNSAPTAIFYASYGNGFCGHHREKVRARNFEHAARIVAFRMTNTKKCSIRIVGNGDSRTATIFGPGGANLGHVRIEAR